MQINFRPHHFLCAFCFKGKGYSLKFIKNFKALLDVLKDAESEATITVIKETDSICAPCPHRRGTVCTTEDKIHHLDQGHAQALDLTINDTFTWEEVRERIQQKMTLATFHEICASCEWKKYGMCEEVLTEFLK